MRIHFVHKSWQVGGVERTNEQWIKILQKQNLKCLVHSNCDAETSISSGDFMPYRTFDGLKTGILESVQRGDYLIICQSSIIRHLFIELLVLRLRGVRVVLTERNSTSQYNHLKVKKFFFSVFLVLFQLFFFRVICNSHDLAKQIPFRLMANARVVLNPRFDGDEKHRLVSSFHRNVERLVFIGRWTTQKGSAYLESVLPRLLEDDIEVVAYCGEDDFHYQRPFIKDVLQFLSEEPVALIFCSEFEGYPNILIEARALGVPVVYAPCETGVREILNDFELALIFRKDDYESLRAACRSVIGTNRGGFDNKFFDQHTIGASNLVDALGLSASPTDRIR